MLKRYRGFILAALGGLAASAALVGLGSAWLYSYRQFYEPAEQEYAVERYQPARDAVKPSSLPKNQPPSKAYQPYCDQPQNREDADLCAQWGAVRAVSETNRLTRIALKLGFIGFWIAMLGGLIGIVGTIFLVRTFRENRRSADAAHDANRPWIDIVIVGKPHLKIRDGEASVKVTIKLLNRGKSPATNVMAITQLAGVPIIGPIHDDAPIRKLEKLFDDWTVHDRTMGITAFPTSETKQVHVSHFSDDEWEELSGGEPGPMVFYLGIGVRYRFGERRAKTLYGYTLIDLDSLELAFPPDNASVTGKRLRVDDNYRGYAT